MWIEPTHNQRQNQRGYMIIDIEIANARAVEDDDDDDDNKR